METSSQLDALMTLKPSIGGFYGNIEALGEPTDTELMLTCLDPFIIRVEWNRIVA